MLRRTITLGYSHVFILPLSLFNYLFFPVPPKVFPHNTSTTSASITTPALASSLVTPRLLIAFFILSSFNLPQLSVLPVCLHKHPYSCFVISHTASALSPSLSPLPSSPLSCLSCPILPHDRLHSHPCVSFVHCHTAPPPSVIFIHSLTLTHTEVIRGRRHTKSQYYEWMDCVGLLLHLSFSLRVAFVCFSNGCMCLSESLSVCLFILVCLSSNFFLSVRIFFFGLFYLQTLILFIIYKRIIHSAITDGYQAKQNRLFPPLLSLHM